MGTNNPFFYYLSIIIVCFFSFFIYNNTIPADLMESRNLATAQEMVNTGNYLIPTMNNELRLEKPPLPTWIAAGIEYISPYNIVAQRAVAGLIATVMIFFMFFLVRRLTKNYPLSLITSLILATCFNVVMMGRTATWDIYCHSFMLGAIYFLVCGLDTKGRRWGQFILSGIFMGLSFLSKGPVSFYALLLPFLISYIITVRPSTKGKRLPILCMMVLMLIISFWWPVFIALFHPEMGVAVASKESGAWLSHNVRPIWYYWQFPAEAGIWALFWVTSLFYYFFRKKPEQRNIYRLSLIWTIAAFVLLSLIPEKKTRYLLPMLVPGALNIAFYIWYNMKSILDKKEKLLLQINGIVVALLALSVPIAIYIIFTKNGGSIDFSFYLLTLVFWIIAIYLGIGLFGKMNFSPFKIYTGTVLLMICFMLFCYGPTTRLFVNQERHSISLLRKNKQAKELNLYHPEEEFLRMELVYEAGRNITPLNIGDTTLIYSKLPFILVSEQSATEVLEGMDVETEYIDTFDNNWRKTDSKRHNDELVKEVYIVKAKQKAE